jgi:DHA1 family multidrug resistance protein-like MFS transporter
LELPSTTIQQILARPGVVALLGFALVVETGYAVLNISTMPVYLKSERDFGEFGISMVLVAFLLSEALLKGPFGRLADRIGTWPLLLAGPLLSMGTSLLTPFVPDSDFESWALMGLRVLDGVGAAAVWPAAFAHMSLLVSDSERQRGLSLLNTCYLIGIAVALPLGGVVEQVSGSLSSGLTLSAVLFGLAASVLLFGAWPKWRREDTVTVTRPLVAVLREIPTLLLIAFFAFLAVGFPMATLKLFAQDQLGLSGAAFGGLMMPGAIALAALSVPMTKLGERLGACAAVNFGLLMAVFGLWVISGTSGWSATPWWIVAISGIPVGLGFLLAMPAWLALVTQCDSADRGTRLGAVMAAQGFGAIVGMPVGGALYEHVSPGSPFVASAFAVSVALCISCTLARKE